MKELETKKESSQHLVFFDKYMTKYNQLNDDILQRKFVDSFFKKLLLENYLRLTNKIIKEKKRLILDKHAVFT